MGVRVTVAYGQGEYGAIYHRDGRRSATRFFFINYFPLIPLGGANGPFYLPSLLYALFNSWGLVALIVMLVRASNGRSTTATSVAIGFMVVLFVSWFWGGGSWRAPGMAKRNLVMGGVLMAVALAAGSYLTVETMAKQRRLAEEEAARIDRQTTPEQKANALLGMLGALQKASESGERARLKTLCDGGNLRSCTDHGQLLENGTDGARDPAQAAEIYRRTCTANEPYGCARLGFLTKYGTGIPFNAAAAFALFTKACDGGNGWGCYHLGEMTTSGLGTLKNPATAKAFYQRGCKLGFEGACNK